MDHLGFEPGDGDVAQDLVVVEGRAGVHAVVLGEVGPGLLREHRRARLEFLLVHELGEPVHLLVVCRVGGGEL